MVPLKPRVEELLRLQFNFDNPVYGLALLTALIILSRKWGLKKAFSYCLLTASVLYLSTRISATLNVPIEGSGVTYADVIRGAGLFILVVVTIYYFFIRNE